MAAFDCSQFDLLDAIPKAGFDPVLESKFPARIGGHAVSGLTSVSQMGVLCRNPDGGLLARQFAGALPPGWDASDVTFASGGYDFPEHPNLTAQRMPEHLASMMLEATLASGGVSPGTYSHAEIGGKEVTVHPEDAGTQYLYPTADVLFILFETDESNATEIIKALP